MRLHERCSACDMRLGDRIFILLPMALLYFGFTPSSLWLRMLFLGLVLIPLIATMPQRFGACLAIDYLSRTRSIVESGTSDE